MTLNKKENYLLIAVIFAFIIAFAGVFQACNYQPVDLTYSYDRAIIQLQTGEVVEIDVAGWKDYEGEQLQIMATDGTIYLTSSYNCTLIQNAESNRIP